MDRYPALIDGAEGGYGVAFPDLPGIVAMGGALDEALLNAEEALRDAAREAWRDGKALAPPSAFESIPVAPGSATVLVPLIPSANP